MKVLAPLSTIDNYEVLVAAGADEFYCGVVPASWFKSYGTSIPINRREVMDGSNIYTMSSMRILSKMVDHYRVPVKIAFNALYYHEEKYPLLLEIMKQLIELGFDNFILADLALIIYLREQGISCKIHLSGETPVINQEAIHFFNQLGIARYIFPRKTLIREIEACIANNPKPGIEYEAFILNENCRYIGAFCNTLHCDELVSACFIPRRVDKTTPSSHRFKEVYRFLKLVHSYKGEAKPQENQYRLADHGCGLCQIKRLMEIGVTNLKVVGRGKNVENIARDLSLLKQIIELAKDSSSSDGFSSYIKEHYFNGLCPADTLSCYFPESQQ